MFAREPRRAFPLTVALVVLAAISYFVLLAPGVSGADGEAQPTAVVEMAIVNGKMKFVYPKTVNEGEQLEIVNKTNPRQVGPHTFSLVQPGTLPKNKSQRQSCFTPKHICLSIAEWHKFNPKTEQISVNPTKAGAAGWSTMGNNSKKGDSWFTGETKGTSFSQKVSAQAGTAIHFICAVHPWMQGKIEVLSQPAS